MKEKPTVIAERMGGGVFKPNKTTKSRASAFHLQVVCHQILPVEEYDILIFFY
jgi:hypothetical protein